MIYKVIRENNKLSYYREDDSLAIEFDLSDNTEEVLKMEFINLVKAHRVGCKLTQEQMAEKIGVSINTYRSLECNPNSFTVEQVKKFINAINEFDKNITSLDVLNIFFK